MQSRNESVFSVGWLALFPVVYLIHLLDERFFGAGTADFATRYLGISFSNRAWLAVNIPSFLAVAASAWLAGRRSWPAWVAVALATHLALHALARVPPSLWFVTIAPGLLSGLILCLPLAIATYIRGQRILSSAQLRTGVIVGVLSFQPLWHFLLLPILPHV